jgi:CRISPR-associated endonuclease Cas1
MTPGAFVAKAQKRIVVRHKGLKVADIATAGLRNISILAAGVSLSSSLIQFCMQHDISIDFIDFKGVPYAKIIDFEHFSASVGIAQLLALHNGIGAHIALKIIEGKISNQMSLLKYLNKYRGKAVAGSQLPTHIAAMKTTRAELKPLIEAIDQGQTINLAELRGKVFSIEGRSAQYYWKGVAEVLQTKVAFEGRERQGATDLVNSMLNYGYALLYSRVWSAVLKAGLNPNISYLHAEQTNKPTLIYDLVEEFRAHVVDRPLLAMLVKEHLPTIEKGLLTEESRRRIVDKVIRKLNAYEQFRGKEMTLSDIIKHQAGAVADCVMQKNTHYKPYLAKW